MINLFIGFLLEGILKERLHKSLSSFKGLKQLIVHCLNLFCYNIFMEKERIIKAIKEALSKFPEIVFAYIFGSFLDSGDFNDIDIAIYVKGDYNPFVLPVKIKEEISSSKILKDRYPPDLFDVRILNDAPFYFTGEIMTDGLLIIDRDFEQRAALAEKISAKYRECAGILKEASIL